MCPPFRSLSVRECRSSGDGRAVGEPLSACGEGACPGLALVDAQPATTGVLREAGAQVVETEAHGVGLCVGEVLNIVQTRSRTHASR